MACPQLRRQTAPLYGEAIRANKLGAFVMGGEPFQVIRPGYDIQGRRRTTWTQIIHEDIPIFTARKDAPLREVIAQFESLWSRAIGEDRDLLLRALAACKKEHRRKFRDGESGEAPAPTISRDGKRETQAYIS